MKIINRLWKDEAGFIVSSELILIATILVIAMVVGLVTIRDQIVQELADVADAFSESNQSYSYHGLVGCQDSVFVAGSVFGDLNDFCELDGNISDQSPGVAPQCLDMAITAVAE